MNAPQRARTEQARHTTDEVDGFLDEVDARMDAVPEGGPEVAKPDHVQPVPVKDNSDDR